MLPIRRILVPVDFSDASSAALDHAVVMGREFTAELLLLHVLPPISVPTTDMLYIHVESDRERRQIAMERLQSLKRARFPGDPHCAVEVRIGDAADEIVKSVHDYECDLIVMSTHGLSGWQHLVLGSVAEAVARMATCPVLTVRCRPDGTVVEPQPIRTVLCPTDFSEASLMAIAIGGELAENWCASLRLMHVLDSPGPALGLVAPQEFLDDYAGEAARALLPVIEQNVPVELRADTKLHRLICEGHAAREIVRVAKSEEVDLIVMATHGRTGLRHMVFGSVAEEVVRTAPCLVLTLHDGTAPYNESVEYAQPHLHQTQVNS